MKPVYAVDGDDDDNDDDDGGGDCRGDRVFALTLVAAVEVLRGHFATYLDLPAYIRK